MIKDNQTNLKMYSIIYCHLMVIIKDFSTSYIDEMPVVHFIGITINIICSLISVIILINNKCIMFDLFMHEVSKFHGSI